MVHSFCNGRNTISGCQLDNDRVSPSIFNRHGSVLQWAAIVLHQVKLTIYQYPTLLESIQEQIPATSRKTLNWERSIGSLPEFLIFSDYIGGTVFHGG